MPIVDASPALDDALLTQTLPDLFERCVADAPDAAGVSCDDQILTFGVLNARANRVARLLIARGVGPETLVALLVPRSTEAIVGVLAILKAGGAYLPLDPAHPRQRLATILREAAPALTVTVSALSARLAQLPYIWLDDVTVHHSTSASEHANPGDGDRRQALTARHPAYAIATSGSTGTPKVVVVAHASVVNLLVGLRERVYRHEGDRRLRVAVNGSLSVDTSVKQVVQLLLGHTLDIVPEHARRDGRVLRGFLEQRQLEVLDAVPSQAQALANAGLFERAGALRLLLVGGEAIDPITWRHLRQAHEMRAFNLYGPTECTVDATSCEIASAGNSPLIGVPLHNTRVAVLGARLEPMPREQSGELYISGIPLARGYLRQPALTATRFVADPNGPPGARAYRTGDRVRWTVDGQIEFIGRCDDQLKVRGFRVEPGEVEAVLRQIPAVRAAVVVGRKSASVGHELHAAVVLSEPNSVTIHDLRSAVAERVPDHMVPTGLHLLDAIPLMPTGKVDRAAVLARVQESSRDDLDGVDITRSPIEEVVAAVWRRVLGSGPFGRDDDFFELGGDSLHAMSAVDHIRRALDVDLPLDRLFQYPTVRSLGMEIERLQMGVGVGRAGPQPVARDGALPVSSSQARVWLIHQLDPSHRAYVFQAKLHIQGRLDTSLLESALRTIAERHEIYRTTFAADLAGIPYAIVHDRLDPFPFRAVDLSGIAQSERRSRAEELMAAEIAQPFTLDRLPLVRWTLYRLDVHAHVLLHIAHHLLHDGWSFNRFLEELSALCQPLQRGTRPSLPPLTVQFVDWAAWEREWLKTEEAASAVAFWTQRLIDAPPPVPLPADRERPASFNFEGRSVRWRLKQGLFERVRALARREGVSGYAVLLTAFVGLLHRYGAPEDLCIGVGAANRRQAELESLIGMFVNTLALRLVLPPNGTAREWLQHVWRAARDAYVRQACPLDVVVRAIGPSRTASQNPLFNVMFNIHDAPLRNIAWPDVSITLEEGINNGSAKFDLNVIVIPPLSHDGALSREHDPCATVNWEYSSALFDRWRIEQMAAHYERLLEAIVEDTSQRVDSLDLLGANERRQILLAAEGETSTISTLSLAALFEQHADIRPDAVAVVYGDQVLTYGQLETRANRLAHLLGARGVEASGIVGICLERSIDFIIAMIGVVKARAAYLPLDSTYPAARLQAMIRDASPACVVTTRALASAILVDEQVLPLDAHKTLNAMADASCRRPRFGATAADELPVYVMYTSGSTGTPKGVVVTTGGVKRLVCEPAYVTLDPDQVILQLASTAFDAATFEIWGALLNGARLVLAPEGTPSLEGIGRTLQREAVTTCWLTAGLFHAIVHERLAALSGLSQLLAGGDVLGIKEVEAVQQAFPGLRVVNGYGPTECTTFACCHQIRPGDTVGGSVPIGRPIAQTRIRVLDERLKPMPCGIWGELYIGGRGLGLGYVKQPSATAGRFVADPLGPPGSRMYRTGDIVRCRPDNTLEFRGRADGQVKIRGFRVEPGDVETALRDDSRVSEAIVVADGESDRRRLVAYVLTANGQVDQDLGAALRLALRARLPDYMIPATVTCVAAWPMTPSGKIDRRALPPVTAPRIAASHVRTPEEEILCALFANLLDMAEVGVDDDFFSLGGHSLLAARLVSRIRVVFGVEIAIRTIFEAATPRQLAGCVTTGHAARPPLAACARPTPLPVSSAQRRLWFLWQLDPTSTDYNMLTAWHLRGPLDVRALDAALHAIVQRHESLRTHFESVDGEPVQVIESECRIAIRVEDLAAVDRVAPTVHEVWNEPFDLSQGPLLRVRLLRLAPDHHVFVRVCHHIVTDGWSEGVFNRELFQMYEACRARKPSPLPPINVQYADFAVWQQQLLRETPAIREGLRFWCEQLSGAPERLSLPCDRPRHAMRTGVAARHERVLPPELLSALQRRSREHGATLYMLLLTAYAMTLSRHSGLDDIVIGSPIANRQDVQLEELIGYFANTLALRVQIDPDATLADLIRTVRARTLEAYRYQEVPFEQVVEAVAPARALGATPLYQVTLTLQNAPSGSVDFSDLRVEPVARVAYRVRTDLELHTIESAAGLSTRWVYDEALFDRWRIEQMAEQYQRVLEAIVADDAQRVGEVELLRGEERCRLLGQIERTASARSIRSSATLPWLFEQAMAGTPDAVAIACDGAALTYCALNARATCIAHRLRAAGVGPEHIVAVAFEPSIEMIMAILGVSKAGAAYLPLDPMYPAPRLRLMLEDAAASALVSVGTILEHMSPHAADLGLPVFAIDELLNEVKESGLSGNQLPPDVQPDHPAYVIFTSGSTGRPKGVVVTHDNVVRLFATSHPQFQFGPDDVWTFFHSYAFDFSVWEMWGALLHGGRLVIVPYLTARAPAEFAALLSREQVTVLNQTPSAFYQLLQLDRDISALRRCTALRVVVFGGEALDTARIASWLHTCGGNPPALVNMYGITETTVHVTSMPLDAAVAATAGSSLIGRPLRDLRTYVLDRRLRPVPVGVTGDLYVAGAGLARGYINQSALTAQRFLADPYGPSGTRMYRTGDLARWRPDGGLEFLGRADQQVKLRGFRIELGEIEATLRRQPEVRDALVTVHGEGGTARLVAYVLATGVPPSADLTDRLHRSLRQTLPDYMVPSAFAVLDRWPLTANGKLDRRALPEPDAPPTRGGEPRTPTEELLCALMAGVLGLEHVGIDDDFFALGGHSLLATRLTSRIRTALGLELPIRALFEAPKVRDLSQRIHQQRSERFILAPQVRPPVVPLSYAQKRLWFLDQLGEGSTEYHMPMALRLRGPLDAAALQAAFQRIADRHETLRTHFVDADGEPHQVIESAMRIPCDTEDLRGIEPVAQETRVRAAMRQEWNEPFDLARGPLLRARLLRLTDDDHVLLRTIHHIVSDGWSEAVFNQELFTLYEAARSNQTASLPRLAIQYADFAICQHTMLADGRLQRGMAYWTRQLAGLAPLELPMDGVRPTRPSSDARKHYHTVAASRLSALKRVSHAHQATLHMTLLSAFALLLGRYTGQRDLAVGVGVANRQHEHLESLIGFFVNTLVIRIRLSPEMTVPELLAQIKRTTLDAYEHQDVPFDRLVEALAPERQANRVPLVQTVFAMQTPPGIPSRLGDLVIERLSDDAPRTRFDLEVDVFERSGQLTVCWLYNRALFEAWRIEQMARHYDLLLDTVVRACDPEATLARSDRTDVADDTHSQSDAAGRLRAPIA